LVTLDDVIEAIVGDLPAADGEEPADVVQRDDGSWLIDGSVSLDRLRETLGRDFSFPDEETGEYRTIAGLVITALGRIPSVGDVLVLQGYRFEVVDMDRQRVDRVMLSLLPPAQASP
jgi:putative hemolysin